MELRDVRTAAKCKKELYKQTLLTQIHARALAFERDGCMAPWGEYAALAVEGVYFVLVCGVGYCLLLIVSNYLLLIVSNK